MLRKFVILLVLATPFFVAGCHHSKVKNPIANIDSKQPDKVLYDRAMVSMKKGRYTEARTLLETLINTYPDSEYVARAKLSLGDAWYAEGGTAARAQAEVEYLDFKTFFPNMPEAAEAQFKVGEIHYQQMEKPDRDYQQAIRAADAYKTLIQEYPDSKLVPQAKQRLRDVQEVLADRQWRIAHFYYLRGNLAAAQARLTSLVDSYPLYSGVDDAMYLLGSIYEKEAAGMRMQKQLAETKRAQLAAEYDQKAVETYSKIITRYPAMDRAEDARKKLVAMKAPVPTPTPEAIAKNEAEEDSREESGRFHKIMGNFKKHPDTAKSAKVGEPPLEQEEVQSAAAVVQHIEGQIKEAAGVSTQKATVESVKAGTGPAPGANQPPPSSGDAQPANNGNTQPAAAGTTAPKRGNEIGATTDSGTQNATQTTQDSQQQNTDDKQDSSSKKKHKKGLRKLIPF